MNFAFTFRLQNASLRLKMDGWQNLRRRPFVIIIVVMHELASAFLIADRMLLIDKVKILALGAVDGHRVAPRVGCHLHLFSGRRSHRAANLKESKS